LRQWDRFGFGLGTEPHELREAALTGQPRCQHGARRGRPLADEVVRHAGSVAREVGDAPRDRDQLSQPLPAVLVTPPDGSETDTEFPSGKFDDVAVVDAEGCLTQLAGLAVQMT